MPNDIDYYAKSEVYTRDILKMLADDPSFKFADYDNDGPMVFPTAVTMMDMWIILSSCRAQGRTILS